MGIPLPVVTTRYFPYSSSTHLSLAVQSEQEPHKGGATPLCLHHFAPTYSLILKQEFYVHVKSSQCTQLTILSLHV